MAVSFNKLKDPKLQLTDKLTFGKFKDCRLCDIIQDHYEYLIWAEKQGFVKFSREAEILIAEQASFKAWEAPVEDEPRELYYRDKGWCTDWDDDIPF